MSPADVLVLTPQDVRSLLSMDECIAAVEQAFRVYGEGKAVPPAVLSVHVQHGGFHVKAGVLGLQRPYFAAKVNGNFPENHSRFGLPTIQGVIVVCDADCGRPLAVMDSRDITTLRTAAATAVAAKHLSREDSRIVTLCGCGQQGRSQVRALVRVRQIQEVYAYDKNEDQARQFANEMTRDLAISVKAVTDLAAGTRQSDICVTCTTSCEPFLGVNDVRPGTFIAAVGADNPHKQELHPDLMAAGKVVVDVLGQCAVMGDLHHALEARAMTKSDVHADLGEVVAGKKPGRGSAEEIVIFDSTGMALQDVAAAALVYEKAESQGSGVRLSFAA